MNNLINSGVIIILIFFLDLKIKKFLNIIFWFHKETIYCHLWNLWFWKGRDLKIINMILKQVKIFSYI